MIIEKIERSIEYYANKTGEYPKYIRMNNKTYEILVKEMTKEYSKIKEKCEDFESFRGCKIKIDNNLQDSKIKVCYEIIESKGKK